MSGRSVLLLAALALVGCATQPVSPIVSSPAAQVGAGPDANGLTPAMRVEAADANWQACVFDSARHLAARAGREGVGVPGGDAVLAACSREVDALKAEIAAYAQPGRERIPSFDARWELVRPNVQALINDTYQSHNYD